MDDIVGFRFDEFRTCVGGGIVSCVGDDPATCSTNQTHVFPHRRSSSQFSLRQAPQRKNFYCVCEAKSVLEKFLNTLYSPTGIQNNISNNSLTISTHPIPNSSSVINDPNSSVMDTSDLIQRMKPDNPYFLFRPHRLHESAKWFSQNFPGEAFYAVKANPGPHVLQELWNGGIHCFDVASLCEIRLVHSLFPNSKLAFMHPIKNFNVISIAYRDYGVRRFVLDSPEELEKIMKATNGATDLTLIVRFSVSNYGSSLPLTGKFGISGDAAVSLMQATRTVAQSLGISFHVGSQAMKPISYNMALSSIAAVVTAANVEVDIVDVGGGFPSIYDMESPPPLDEYLLSITSAVKSVKCFENSALWCEPGRALSAEGEGLLTRVEGVKKGAIYLNDGSFGALYDSVHERWSYPVRVVKSSGRAYPVMPTHRADEVDELMFETDSSSDSIRLVPYIIYGPTCDSADKFPEPLMLPEGLAEGDYLEWGNIGAYGRSMITTFNGFGFYETLIVHDSPWPTLYAPSEEVSLEGISSVLTNFPEEEIFLLDLSRALNNSSSSLYSIDDNNSTHSSDTPSPIGSRVSFQDQSPTQMLFGEPEGVF